MTFARTRAEGPALMVLFTQSSVWLRLNDAQRGAIYHSAPAAQNEAVMLLPDMAYPLLIKGKTTLSELQERGVLRIYADDESYALNLL